jgi:ankyrin repeat protein
MDHSGYTALMIAALKGFAGVLALLVDYGADPHHAGHDGVTALSLAQDAGYAGIVALLRGAIPQ